MMADIKENIDTLHAVDLNEELLHKPLFDAQGFCNEHGELKLVDYKLTKD